jgi:BirA family biotin operon repressor/biotin-[acetyl-CoA-carboxylase] ligase
MPLTFDDRTLFQHLTTQRIGQQLVFFESTDSTNSRAIAAVGSGSASDGATFVAAHQTAGRGTDDHPWESANAQGLWMSVVYFEPLRSRPLSFLPGIAIANVLRKEYGVMAHLKWPNDVLVGTKKVAGVLIESAESPDRQGAWVVGIGVNLNQEEFASPLDSVAVSLKQLVGQPVPVPQFFGHLMSELERQNDGCVLAGRWTALSRMPGKTIKLKRGKETLAVRADGVSPEGYLQVTHADGMRETIVGVTGLDIDRHY